MRFSTWMETLYEDVILGQHGRDPEEFLVYARTWRPFYDKGLTPEQAFDRVLTIAERARAEGEKLRAAQQSRTKRSDNAYRRRRRA